MTSIFVSLLLLFGIPIAAVTDPKDALINPRGQKVCMQQCGTSALKCPETFWSEQLDFCYRCCTTWGETVIRVECDKSRKNGTAKASAIVSGKDVNEKETIDQQGNKTVVDEKKDVEQMTKTVIGEQKEPQRELGFS